MKRLTAFAILAITGLLFATPGEAVTLKADINPNITPGEFLVPTDRDNPDFICDQLDRNCRADCDYLYPPSMWDWLFDNDDEWFACNAICARQHRFCLKGL